MRSPTGLRRRTFPSSWTSSESFRTPRPESLGLEADDSLRGNEEPCQAGRNSECLREVLRSRGGDFQDRRDVLRPPAGSGGGPSREVPLGHSAGYPLPTASIERLLSNGGELEQLAERLSGVGQIGDKGGLVHHLTGGKVTRSDLTEQCVVMALIPWLHADEYGF
ncbi:MAG: DUF84 family protein [Thaumarchaeota archaeon]|nr:DUF84 family protein [Nitrososphaerota archaeon]